MQNVRASLKYHDCLRVTLVMPVFIFDRLIHFSLNGLPAGDMLVSVDHMGVCNVASVQAYITNVISKL